MWIRTQNKQRIVNSDQIVDISIDRTGTKIIAGILLNEGRFDYTLGKYEDIDVCLKILEKLQTVSMISYSYEEMPLSSDVDEWLNEEI